MGQTAGNAEQKDLWDGAKGDAWVDMQDTMDAMFFAFERRLGAAVEARSASNVLDIGCGSGTTTLAAARALSKDGTCTGVDLSHAMLSLARKRAAKEALRADFIAADAQTYEFDPNQYDMLISRFGVMFFSDNLAAFSNLRRAALEGAALCFFAWQSMKVNPFMVVAEMAARQHFPDIPLRTDDVPGPFGLADNSKVASLLENAGWADIEIRPVNEECAFPLDRLEDFFMRIGPLGQYLQKRGHAPAKDMMEGIGAAYSDYIYGNEVRFNAACWQITARAA